MNWKFWEKQSAPALPGFQEPAKSLEDVIRERRTGFFATDFQPSTKLLAFKDRFSMALKMSLQVPHEFKTIGSAGEAMDSNVQQAKIINSSQGFMPIGQFEYFASQGFIGWQTCAILMQNWLIAKVCTMPGKDAVRHGWEISVTDDIEIMPKMFDQLKRLDKRFKVKKNCIEYLKFGRGFGIRHCLFLIDGIDYEAPFNIDGVRPGAYRGMSQIDPYWMSPELDASAAADPASKDFYEPTWWRINGKRVHKSHFVIFRNDDDVADLLKPSYIYGGVPVPQQIYERVFAAECTANEAPKLAMSKRMTTFKTDVTAVMADTEKFNEKMGIWTALMNNFGIKVVGEGDEIQQFETSLADLDSVIMTQYQLVAAAGRVPSTKLLGTTPKGFSATGEYDESSYHEELESIQENDLSPLIERHTLLCLKSYILPKFGGAMFNFEINWLPVDSPTAKEVAETNKIKAETDASLVNAGVLDGLDVRQRLITDRDSGYDGIAAVVPGGPGDRVAEQEMKEALLEGPSDPDGASAQDTIGSLGHFDPAMGTIGGARIITHQRFLDDAIVLQKIEARDFVVDLTPEFVDDGKRYRMVIDGHHSLAAAMVAKCTPIFIEGVPREVVFNPVTGQATDSAE